VALPVAAHSLRAGHGVVTEQWPRQGRGCDGSAYGRGRSRNGDSAVASMLALPVIAFFILAPPHHWSDSLGIAPLKCGLLTTSALSPAQLLRLHPACPDEGLIRQERMPYK